MPKPYSLDLRQRVVKAYEEGNESYAAVGAHFNVGEATVNRWVARFRSTGSLEPLPHGRGPDSIVDEKGLSVLCALIDEQHLRHDRTNRPPVPHDAARRPTRVSPRRRSIRVARHGGPRVCRVFAFSLAARRYGCPRQREVGSR
jgi:transposase-like protein